MEFWTFNVTGSFASSKDAHDQNYSVEPVKIEDHPYIAFIQISGIPVCIGTIVTEKFVLTLTSCLRDYDELQKLEIRVGSSTIMNGTTYSIRGVHHHPEFQMNSNEDNYINDIALIELKDPIERKFGKPVELFNEDEIAVTGSPALVIGFNQEKMGLLKFAIPVISPQECGRIYKNLRTLSFDQICAGKKSSFEEMCLMDKGAPLVVQNRQLGIYDEMRDCKKWFDKPMIYTSIAQHRDWINKIVPDLENKKKPEVVEADEEKSSILLYIIVGVVVLIVALAALGFLAYNKWFKKWYNILSLEYSEENKI